jgi:hypothetical protein
LEILLYAQFSRLYSRLILYYTKFLKRRLRKMVKIFTQKGLYKDVKMGYYTLYYKKADN